MTVDLALPQLYAPRSMGTFLRGVVSCMGRGSSQARGTQPKFLKCGPRPSLHIHSPKPIPKDPTNPRTWIGSVAVSRSYYYAFPSLAKEHSNSQSSLSSESTIFLTFSLTGPSGYRQTPPRPFSTYVSRKYFYQPSISPYRQQEWRALTEPANEAFTMMKSDRATGQMR